jgi:hypothetical protein
VLKSFSRRSPLLPFSVEQTPRGVSQNVQQDSRLPRASGKFVSHVLTLITENGLAQAINVLGTLLLARLFTPSAFGSLALFVTLDSFLSVLGGAVLTRRHTTGKQRRSGEYSFSLDANALWDLWNIILVGCVASFSDRSASWE